MTIDWNKPVQTKSGAPVTILSRAGRGPYPIIGYIAENPYLSSWPAEKHGLVNVPEKPREIWVNRYNDGSWSGVYPIKEAAIASSMLYVVETVLFREVKE